MSSRLFFRSLQNALIHNNPVVVFAAQLKRIYTFYFELSGKSKNLSGNINQVKNRLEKVRNIIKVNSNSNDPINMNVIQ